MDILEQINSLPDRLCTSDNFSRDNINVARVVTSNKNQPPSTGYIDLCAKGGECIRSTDPVTRFEPIIPYSNPMSKIQRHITYVTGKSGTGKTLIACEFAKQYHQLNPDNKIFYICSTDIKDDENFGTMDYVKALDVSKFYSNTIKPDDEKELIKRLFTNCYVIFDDLDMAPKEQKQIITRLQFKLIEVGRKFGTSIFIISHLNTNGHQTKMLMNEIDLYICFKEGLKKNRLLEHYQNYTQDELRKIDTKSWVCFNFRYNCIITPTRVLIKD